MTIKMLSLHQQGNSKVYLQIVSHLHKYLFKFNIKTLRKTSIIFLMIVFCEWPVLWTRMCDGVPNSNEDCFYHQTNKQKLK